MNEQVDDEDLCPLCPNCGHLSCRHLTCCEWMSVGGLWCPCAWGRGRATAAGLDAEEDEEDTLTT